MHRYLLSLACLCILTACSGESQTPAASSTNDSPEGAVKTMLESFGGNDVAAIFAVAAPETQAMARAEYEAMQAAETTPEEQAQFDGTLSMLTAEGAEGTLLAMAKPQLAEAQQGVAMMAAMLPMMAGQAIAEQDLTPEEQQQSMAMLTALSGWLAGLDVTDEAKLEEAIGVLCTTARDLKFSNHAEMKAMDFDTMLGEAGKGLKGVKEVLKIYGVDVDATLKSVDVGSPEIDGDTAKVPYSITIMGEQHDAMVEVEKIDGKWYLAAKDNASDLDIPEGELENGPGGIDPMP